MWVCFTITIVFVHFLASKLDEVGSESSFGNWWVIYSPMWIVHVILALSFIIFLWVFPDLAFVDDSTTGHIRPTLVIHIFNFLSSSLFRYNEKPRESYRGAVYQATTASYFLFHRHLRPQHSHGSCTLTDTIIYTPRFNKLSDRRDDDRVCSLILCCVIT
jgi:hypothetical protein